MLSRDFDFLSDTLVLIGYFLGLNQKDLLFLFLAIADELSVLASVSLPIYLLYLGYFCVSAVF